MGECIVNLRIDGTFRAIDASNSAFSLKTLTPGVHCALVYDRCHEPIFMTRKSFNFPPRWNEIFRRHEEYSPDNSDNFYYLEVIELESKRDPGCSEGNRVVGRAVIPWPEGAGVAVKQVIELVGVEGYETRVSGMILVELRVDQVCEEKSFVGTGKSCITIYDGNDHHAYT